MALKVWLPLNKSTKNFGLFNSKPIPNNVELSTGGVFNNCYKFSNNTNSYIDANIKTSDLFEDNASYSVAFWVKLSAYPSTTPGGIFGSNKYISEQTTGNYKGGGFGVLLYSNYINIIHANSTTNQGKQVNNIPLNTWLHIAICYNNNGNIVRCYVNGEKRLETTFTINYSTNGSGFIIGRNSQGGCTNPSEKYINDFRIYDNCLSEEDVKRIYQNRSIFEIPYSRETEKPEYPLWLKLLHHNAPASNLFTTANYKKNTSDNLYSRCGWMFNNTIFKLDNGNYEFFAKDQMATGGTQNTYRWTQTSSPTASTITGFKKITNSCNSSYLVGLKNGGNYSAFHNGGSWWCACGSYTAYQGGTPGFQGVVTTGYMDLFVRAEIKHLPNDYEELQYITFNGTHYFYIDKPSGTHSSMKIEFGIEPDTESHSQPTFFSNKNGGVQFYRPGYPNISLWTSTGSMGIGTFTSGQNSSLIVELTPSLDKSNLNGYVNSSTASKSFEKLFSTACTHFTVGAYAAGSYPFFGKLSKLKMYIDDCLYFLGIPAKRKSDGIVGMYDIVTKKFKTNVGSGNFVAGPTRYISKDYIELDYIESTGSQYIDTGYIFKYGDSISINLTPKTQTGNKALFGASNGSSWNAGEVAVFWNGGKIDSVIPKSNTSGVYNNFGSYTSGNTITITYDENETKIIGNQSYIQPNTGFYTGYTGNKSIYIFSTHRSSGPVTYGDFKLHNFKIYGQNAIKMNLIPAKRKSDSVIGLYDMVSGQFFTNAGTGSFTGA